MNEVLIVTIIVLVIAAIIAGWFHSPKTRRLSRFALIAIAVGAVLFGLYLLVILIWFPVSL